MSPDIVDISCGQYGYTYTYTYTNTNTYTNTYSNTNIYTYTNTHTNLPVMSSNFYSPSGNQEEQQETMRR
jgi:hypothetical protein